MRSPGPVFPRFDAAVSAPMRAPLFASLVERMGAGGRWVILDLGPARAATVELFSRFRCRLDIVDLAGEIEALNGIGVRDRLRARVESIFRRPEGQPADVVLCWDLLNYMDRPVLAAVMEAAAERSRAGTVVHALMVYSASRIPAQPGLYAPVPGSGAKAHDEVRLVNSAVVDGYRDAPSYTPDDLVRSMAGFRVQRGVLLNNGMQEFLFSL